MARPDGSLTPAGQYYYEQTGQQRPDARFDRNQALIHRGTGDYIRTRRGEQLVRRLMPDGTMRLTALGRTFFRHRHTEYVVHMPVIIRGTRANGRAYERRDYLPVESLGLGQILESQGLTHERAAARVRSKVLRQLDGPTRGGMTVVQEISGEVFYADRDGEWLISAMGTTVNEQGHATTRTELRQPLSEGDPLRGLRAAASFLPHSDQIMDEAFEDHDDNLCVPRQLAILLGWTLQRACDSFDDLLGPEWRNVGVCPQEIEPFFLQHGHPYFLVRCGKLVKIHEPPEKK